MDPVQLRRRTGGRRPLLIGLAGVAVVAVVAVGPRLTGAHGTGRVALVTRDLTAGSRILATDLRFAPVDAPGPVLDQLVTPGSLGGLRGRVLTVGLRAGDVVTATMLAPTPPADGRRAMSVPVPRARAVGGRIVRGDRIDVVVVDDGVPSTTVVGVEVLAVDEVGSGIVATEGDLTITVAVDAHQAEALAAAVAGGQFELARVAGGGAR